jgi:hypothetical protein
MFNAILILFEYNAYNLYDLFRMKLFLISIVKYHLVSLRYFDTLLNIIQALTKYMAVTRLQYKKLVSY